MTTLSIVVLVTVVTAVLDVTFADGNLVNKLDEYTLKFDENVILHPSPYEEILEGKV